MTTENREKAEIAGRNQDRMRPFRALDHISSVPNGIRPPYPIDKLVFDRLPEQPSGRNGPVILMLPGWRSSRNTMRPLGSLLSGCYDTVLLGLPGFSPGESPMHDGQWGTTEYADCVFDFLKENKLSEVIMVGHSFGARVGIQLACKHPEIVRSLVLIAAPGLQPVGVKKLERNLKRRFNRFLRIKTVSWLLSASGKLLPSRFTTLCNLQYRKHFVSNDYQNAGVLRTTLNKAVNENLAPLAPRVRAPTLLLYGEDDAETPPALGERYHRLFPQSSFIVMEGKHHFPHLTMGASLCAYHILRFLSASQASTSKRHE